MMTGTPTITSCNKIILILRTHLRAKHIILRIVSELHREEWSGIIFTGWVS